MIAFMNNLLIDPYVTFTIENKKAMVKGLLRYMNLHKITQEDFINAYEIGFA